MVRFELHEILPKGKTLRIEWYGTFKEALDARRRFDDSNPTRVYAIITVPTESDTEDEEDDY